MRNRLIVRNSLIKSTEFQIYLKNKLKKVRVLYPSRLNGYITVNTPLNINLVYSSIKIDYL